MRGRSDSKTTVLQSLIKFRGTLAVAESADARYRGSPGDAAATGVPAATATDATAAAVALTKGLQRITRLLWNLFAIAANVAFLFLLLLLLLLINPDTWTGIRTPVRSIPHFSEASGKINNVSGLLNLVGSLSHGCTIRGWWSRLRKRYLRSIGQ